ncbi:uncharacterized protein N7459_005455 [Penicillium hispanicum]|uniref:uncharacterized protein n=1 Tax=Penicillium hispanicum TaxID=1080232 RepID=UPI0025408E4E|nr:uncharacterized protein N7459_005455 [Penicillium hispanicum]KAJ5579470.1 hypothetical protein N7459_005455 [Penicillium hispanicum]
MKPSKPRSATMNEQTFIPATMRALYSALPPPTDPTITPESSDGPAPAASLILDTDFPTPQPSAHQYLLKVYAAAFSHDEVRLASALNPSVTTPQIPLHSLCGTVIATPAQDSERPLGPRYQIGDVVFGLLSYTRDGGAADYVLATDDELAFKPANISVSEAAALALPALTAWQALFRFAGLDPDAPAGGNSHGQSNGDLDGNGNRKKLSIGSGSSRGEGTNNRLGSHWLSGNRYRRKSAGGDSGNGHGNGSRNRLFNGNDFLKRKVAPLRVLVTNTRDSEVGRIAVQLLRSEKLFEYPVRPWICVTCTGLEEETVRRDWDVDEILIIPHLPAQNECDLGAMFRSRKWSPVDVVLDCTGGEVFRQAHTSAVVKEYGTVMTAVDQRPAQEPMAMDEQDVLGRRNRGLRSLFVPVNPDHVALARIADLVEGNMVRGRKEQEVDLANAATLLDAGAAGAAGSRRGGMMVVRVN